MKSKTIQDQNMAVASSTYIQKKNVAINKKQYRSSNLTSLKTLNREQITFRRKKRANPMAPSLST